VGPNPVLAGPVAWYGIFQEHFIFLWGFFTSNQFTLFDHTSTWPMYSHILSWQCQNPEFWAVIPCSFVDGYQLFGDACWVYFLDREFSRTVYSSSFKIEADSSETSRICKTTRPTSHYIVTHSWSCIRVLFSQTLTLVYLYIPCLSSKLSCF
jgi:hypothetical protein